MQISDVFVGSSQERTMDRVSPDLPLSPVVVQFGRYLKVIVLLETMDPQSAVQTLPARNAFQVMAQAQRDRASRRYPPPVQQRNKKDQLYNDILSYCEKNQIGWIGNEVDLLAVTFLRPVTDVLWYIDGHHHVFAGRGVHIPDSFSRFQGYNVPELTKHRKRLATNMSSSVLESLSTKRF